MYVKDNWQKILMNSLSGMNVGSRLQGQIILPCPLFPFFPVGI